MGIFLMRYLQGENRSRTALFPVPLDDPADLLKLDLYGYFQRIGSSQRLEAECQRNVEVMWLLVLLAPDFKTIADFRRDNSPAFTATRLRFASLYLLVMCLVSPNGRGAPPPRINPATQPADGPFKVKSCSRACAHFVKW
ncbi:transposase-like protein DUF772 [Pseudomonas jessenii]|uniref:Transposase-like protein DUF772 n=1 Tax=Pseudomonas jessenii TaxID=77298 RepID=A0A370S6T0_PSEJE|nr:transposase-like protein DUF772 [Pseudomonas jessenii]